SFVGHILLHTVTYPEQFPTNSRKVAFSVLFMTYYTATWSQPYLMKVFNAEEVVFNEFLDAFKSSFFDHNCQQVAPNWNSVGLHAGVQLTPHHWMGRYAPLMSLYQHELSPNHLGYEQHPVHLAPDYASDGPEGRPEN
ncbi:uncharacterized protein VP01_10139g2, partial [Puccinia sorghi]